MPALSNPRHERFYVYTLSCPKSGAPFYVGKGTGRRRFHHVRDAKNSGLPETRKLAKIRDLLAEGLEPVIAVVLDNLTESAALMEERSLIRRLGYRALTNVLPGSENEVTRNYREAKHNLARLKTEERVKAEGDWWNGAKLDLRLRVRAQMEEQLKDICAKLEAIISGEKIRYGTAHS